MSDETRHGWVYFDGWAGRCKIRAEVLAETPKRFKVRLLSDASRRKPSGAVIYAPKHAVRVDEEQGGSR